MRAVLILVLAFVIVAAGCGGAVCGPGTTLDDGQCVPVTQCGPGTVKEGATCVPSPISCGAGTVLDGGSCVPIPTISCGPGTVLDGGTCVPAPTISCGPGTVLDGDTCVPVPTTTCGPGTVLDGDTCVPAPTTSCGPGTILTGDTCVPAPGDLRGTVTLAGAPSGAGATVVLAGTGRSVTTADDGAFAFEGLTAGSYAVDVSAAGFVPAHTTARVAAGETMVLSIALAAVPAGPSDPGLGGLRGRVSVFGGLGQAIVHVRGGAVDRDVALDASGVFSADDLAPATYVVTFAAPHMVEVNVSAVVPAGVTVPLQEVVLYRGRRVDSRVLLEAAFTRDGAMALVRLQDGPHTGTYLYDVASGSLTTLGTGYMDLLADDGLHAIALAGQTLERIDLLTGAVDSLGELDPSTPSYKTDGTGVVFVDREGDLQRASTADARPILVRKGACGPSKLLRFDFDRTWLDLPVGVRRGYVKVVATNTCATGSETAYLQPTTGYRSGWTAKSAGSPQRPPIVSHVASTTTSGSRDLELFDPATGSASIIASAVRTFTTTSVADLWFVQHDDAPATSSASLYEVGSTALTPVVANAGSVFLSTDSIRGTRGTAPFAYYLAERRFAAPCNDASALNVLAGGVFCIERAPTAMKLQARTATSPTVFPASTITGGVSPTGSSVVTWTADGAFMAAGFSSTTPLTVCPEGGSTFKAFGSTLFAYCGTSPRRAVMADVAAGTVREMLGAGTGNLNTCFTSASGHAGICSYGTTNPADAWACGGGFACAVAIGPAATDRVVLPAPQTTGALIQAAFAPDDTAVFVGLLGPSPATFIRFGGAAPQTTSVSIPFAFPYDLAAGGSRVLLRSGSAQQIVFFDLGAMANIRTFSDSTPTLLAPHLYYVPSGSSVADVASGQVTDLQASGTQPIVGADLGAPRVVTWLASPSNDVRAFVPGTGVTTLVPDLGGTFSNGRSFVWANASTRNATYGILDRDRGTFTPLAAGVVPTLRSCGYLNCAMSDPDATGTRRAVLIDGERGVELGARLTDPVVFWWWTTSTYGFRGLLPSGDRGVLLSRPDAPEPVVITPWAEELYPVDEAIQHFRVSDRGVRSYLKPGAPALPLESLANDPDAEALSPDGTVLLYGLSDAASNGRHGFYAADVR